MPSKLHERVLAMVPELMALYTEYHQGRFTWKELQRRLTIHRRRRHMIDRALRETERRQQKEIARLKREVRRNLAAAKRYRAEAESLRRCRRDGLH